MLVGSGGLVFSVPYLPTFSARNGNQTLQFKSLRLELPG